MYVNGGVTDKDGDTIHTKARLRALIKEDPYLVRFFTTSQVSDEAQWDGHLNRLPADIHLIVTGPDPYHDRRWYADIVRDKAERFTII